MKYVTKVGENIFEIEIEEPGSIMVNGKSRQLNLEEISGSRLYSLLLDGKSHEALVEKHGPNRRQVLLKGNLYTVMVEDERAIRLSRNSADLVVDSGEISIRAPMPGLVVEVRVGVDQQVKKGDVLVILESMKMDNELCAPRDGVTERVRVRKGETVDGGQVLVILE